LYSRTYEVNRAAVGPAAKAVREALIQLGMRQCSLRTVYYQCELRELRLDWYGGFYRWVEALYLANRQGAEFLIEDVLARFESLRASRPPAFDWHELVARCEEAHSQSMLAVIRNQDIGTLAPCLTNAVAAHRDLLSAARARLEETAAVRRVA
jgi:AcrR family transcriptional regulator